MSDQVTVGELKRQLQCLDDDAKVTFSGGLTFYRFRDWEDEVFLEFNEPEADLDDNFKRKNPHIQVAFVRIDDAEWDEDGVVSGPVDVSMR